MTGELIELARAGDGDAFRQLVGPYESELRVHCYRMLGSVHDAEDAMQDALLAAWQGLDSFEGRASVRTWLYHVTTSRCLNVRRSARRRQGMMPPGPPPPEPTRLNEVTWLEPCPESLMAGLPDAGQEPEARYEAREAMSLAFITAMQRLPPRQRAVLILRDVLGFTAREAAGVVGSTEDSVASALKRARASLRSDHADRAEPPRAPGSPREKRLIERLTRAYDTGDVDGIIALFSDDAWLAMPPAALEYQGRDHIRRFLSVIAFRDNRTYRLVPTTANGQLAFGAYLQAPKPGRQANGLLVLSLSGDRIQAMTRFTGDVLPSFGLPPC